MTSQQLTEVFNQLHLFIESLPQPQHNQTLSDFTRGFNYDLFKTLSPRCFDLYNEQATSQKQQLLTSFESVNTSIHNKCQTAPKSTSRIAIPQYHEITYSFQHQPQTTFREPPPPYPTQHHHSTHNYQAHITSFSNPQAGTSTTPSTQHHQPLQHQEPSTSFNHPQEGTSTASYIQHQEPSTSYSHPQEGTSETPPIHQQQLQESPQHQQTYTELQPIQQQESFIQLPPISESPESPEAVTITEEEIEIHQLPSCPTDTCLPSSINSSSGSEATQNSHTDFNQTQRN